MAGRQVAHLLVRRHRGRGAVRNQNIFWETKDFLSFTCAGGSQRWAWPVLLRPTVVAARPEGPSGLHRGAASAGRAGLEEGQAQKIFHKKMRKIFYLPEPQTVPTFAAVETVEPSSAGAEPSASAVVELSVGPPGLSAVSG